MVKVKLSIVVLLLAVFSVSLSAQVSIWVFPHKQQIAVNGIQTFTAVVTGVEDKGISWSTTCGNIIQGLNSTIGLKDNVQQTCTVTATSTADKTKSATGTVTYVATPHFLDGVHPRLLLTPRMVEQMRAQGWATASNPYWRNGLEKAAINAVTEVDAKWCFSFGGNCPKGAKPGQPIRFYEWTIYSPPAVTSLVRDSSGTVTATMASQFNIWTGDSVNIVPAPADRSNFKVGMVTVASVVDGTHFTYKEAGQVAASKAAGTVSVRCGGGNGVNPGIWCDQGAYKTPVLDDTEVYAELFAFLALIDTNPREQEHYRIRAHDMMMWMINLAGDTTSQTCAPNGRFVPFRNCSFVTNDRGHQAGTEAFPLTVDWVYSSFTPAEKKSIDHVFRWWAYETYTRVTTGIPYPLPFGVMNDPVLLAKPNQLRWQMNNFGNSAYRTATMLSLVMDAADDPSDDGNPAHRANVTPSKDGPKTLSLAGYAALSQGAWTYVHWAVAEDPGIVSKVLGVSPVGMGEGQGGLSPEGSEYGGNYGYVAMALLSLHTAGADDPSQMPQLSLMNSSHWDLWVDGLLNIISPVPRSEPAGNFYETSQYGDDQFENLISPYYLKLLMPLGLYDYYTQTNPTRLNAIRWFLKHAQGAGCGNGPRGACGSSSQYLYKRLAGTVGTNDFNNSLYYFLLMDPTATPNSPTNPSGDVDPRPQYPTEFYAPGHHQLAARVSWQPDTSWLVTHCHWTTIDHQRGTCGMTEFYRKGRWLLKAHATYSSGVGALSLFADAGISIGNPSSDPKKDSLFSIIASHGAQFGQQGASTFAPSPLLSSSNNFLYEYFDQTAPHNNDRIYHEPTSDVLHASRSLVWLKPDILVFYDRGTSKSTGMFKKDSFNFTAEPSVSGQVARVVDSATKEQAFLTSLLPMGANFSASSCAYGSKVGDCDGSDVSHGGDESAFLYQVTDTSVPKTAAFLSVLEGVDAGGARTPVTLIQGNGTALEGVQIGNSVVLFKKVAPGFDSGFVASSYSVPASVVNHYVSGLEPGGNYAVEVHANGGKMALTISKRCAANCFAADRGGVLVFNTTSSGGVAKGSKPYASH